MKARDSVVSVTAVIFAPLAVALVGAACSRGREVATSQAPSSMPQVLAAAPASSCEHAVCADNFVIDATPGDCAAGSPCTVTLKVAATGAYHINDEYPYRFRADDTPGVEFLGTDIGGKNTFSKTAGDWKKSEEKAGTMTVKFTVADRGSKTIAGNLKLSVCSPQTCLLEQKQVTTAVLAK